MRAECRGGKMVGRGKERGERRGKWVWEGRGEW